MNGGMPCPYYAPPPPPAKPAGGAQIESGPQMAPQVDNETEADTETKAETDTETKAETETENEVKEAETDLAQLLSAEDYEELMTSYYAHL